MIVYHRANARYDAETVIRLAEEFPNFIGFKDGVCDIDLLATLYANLGDRLIYIGGLPTAETYALPYLELGVTTYSSAIFNFAPQWAVDFYTSVRAHDRRRRARPAPRLRGPLHRHPGPPGGLRRVHRQGRPHRGRRTRPGRSGLR